MSELLHFTSPNRPNLSVSTFLLSSKLFTYSKLFLKNKGKQFEVQLCLQGLLGEKLCLPLVVCAAEDALHTLHYNDVMHISHP